MASMGTLTLIRHGQASFGAADYDQLSEIGQEQSRRLGAYLGHKNVHADVVYRGSLKRHAQTWMGMQEGLALTLGASYQAAVANINPALDEYDGEALINAVKTDVLEHSEGAEAYKQHFRLLRDALGLWMHGQISPKGMPTYALFKSQLLDVMQHICDTHQGQNVWVVSSGGPISTVVGHVLRAPPESSIELNYQINNTALTRFKITSKGLRLAGFNSLPHLDNADDGRLLTFA